MDLEKIHLSIEDARKLCLGILSRQNVSIENASIITEHLLDAAMCGYEYSGLPKLLQLINNPKWVKKTSDIKTIYETPISKLIDGGNQSGMIVLEKASSMLIEMVEKTGIGVLGVHNTWMSGRSAYYVEKIARHKLIGIHTVGASDLVAPFGGARPSLGTNPIAMGFPSNSEPLVIDLSTAAFPGTELDFYALLNLKLPSAVAMDELGQETTNALEAKKGAILPFGGHKGYALALGFQALAILAGSHLSPNRDYGYFFFAFKPDLLMPFNEYEKALIDLIDKVKKTKTLNQFSEIRIPGQRGQKLRHLNKVNGIYLDQKIYKQLLSI